MTRLPLIPKLTPNVTDVASFARAAEEAGADAVSLVNTFLAMAIDVETRRPQALERRSAASAVRRSGRSPCAWCTSARGWCSIPIIGMGGIAGAADALEFIIAGATAVQVGTANFVDPFIWPKLLDGIRPSYMDARTEVAEQARPTWSAASTHRPAEGTHAMKELISSRSTSTDGGPARSARRLGSAACVGGFKIGSQLFTCEGPGHRPATSSSTATASSST